VLETLTTDDFAPLLGDRFALRLSPDVTIEMRLAEVAGRGRPDRAASASMVPSRHGREQFSLTFRGPREPRLGQRIYALEHATLGVLELFLVPLGEDQSGRTYEAAFT
jgi:hypothetical protein